MKKVFAPSPRWFVATKKLISIVTTTTIAIMMVYHPENSMTLLVAKLIQSAVMEATDSIIAALSQP